MRINERVFTVLNTTANRDFRTIRGIAALLDVEPRDVTDAIHGLGADGRIQPEPPDPDFDRSWRTDQTPV